MFTYTPFIHSMTRLCYTSVLLLLLLTACSSLSPWLFIPSLTYVLALHNKVALTPAMGWNTWNRFGCSVDEQLIRATVNAMVHYKLPENGYNYINLDDCWQSPVRNKRTGKVIADPKKFPSGMKSLSSFIHQNNLLFGIYSDAGDKTCAGYPGSRNYELLDAEQYAQSDVDYLKYDNCHVYITDNELELYTKMSDALLHASGGQSENATTRAIYFSMCEWGVAGQYTAA
jgi:alpha-galactosidase